MTFDILLWNYNLKKVKLFINKNNCKPSKLNNNKKLENWLYKQKRNYKYNKDSMKNIIIKNKWKNFINEYKKYFLKNEDKWNNYLKKVKQYINKYKRKPSHGSNNYNINQLSWWINDQKKNYKYKKNIMKNDEFKFKWEIFLNEYKEYF